MRTIYGGPYWLRSWKTAQMIKNRKLTSYSRSLLKCLLVINDYEDEPKKFSSLMTLIFIEVVANSEPIKPLKWDD